MLKELKWQEARELILPLNPELVQVIDEVSPGDECRLIDCSYSYGCEILKHGKFHLPTESGIAALDDQRVNIELQNKLDYNLGSNPAAITLENSFEIFTPQPGKTLPLRGLLSPGSLFGFSRILTKAHLSHQPKFIWEMTAGARSIFMLPKISEQEKFKRLKRTFNLEADKPKLLIDQWEIFKELANHASFEQPWRARILFFSNHWFEHLDDKAWEPFNYYIFRRAWDATDYGRSQYVWNLMFSIIRERKSLQTNSFIADTVKTLLAIAVKGIPAFAPAIDNIAAPIEGLQKIYTEVYGLNQYLPTFMTLHNFDFQEENPRPTYYSLQFPTAIQFAPKSSKHTSLLTDLNDLQVGLSQTLSTLKTNQFNIEQTPLYYIVDEVNFDFYHNNVGQYNNIKESAEIFKYDDSFSNCFYQGDNASHPNSASFLRGCIKIAKA